MAASEYDRGLATGMRLGAKAAMSALDAIRKGEDPQLVLVAMAKTLNDMAKEQGRDAA